MQTADKQQIRAKIQHELERIEQQIIELEALTQPIVPDCAIGRISRMEALNTKSVNEHLLTKSRAKKHKLEISLRAVKQDDYGLCKVCHQPIPVGRLLMLPEADTCVDCA